MKILLALIAVGMAGTVHANPAGIKIGTGTYVYLLDWHSEEALLKKKSPVWIMIWKSTSARECSPGDTELHYNYTVRASQKELKDAYKMFEKMGAMTKRSQPVYLKAYPQP